MFALPLNPGLGWLYCSGFVYSLICVPFQCSDWRINGRGSFKVVLVGKVTFWLGVPATSSCSPNEWTYQCFLLNSYIFLSFTLSALLPVTRNVCVYHFMSSAMQASCVPCSGTIYICSNLIPTPSGHLSLKWSGWKGELVSSSLTFYPCVYSPFHLQSQRSYRLTPCRGIRGRTVSVCWLL